MVKKLNMERKLVNYIPGLIAQRKGQKELNTINGFIFKPEKEGDNINVLHFINERGFRYSLNNSIVYLKHMNRLRDDIEHLKDSLRLEDDVFFDINNETYTVTGINGNEIFIVHDGIITSSVIPRQLILDYFYRNQYDVHNLIDNITVFDY
jgi:hypothetical protein